MTETLTGKQVLALLAQDDVPEIECLVDGEWQQFRESQWGLTSLRVTYVQFRIKPKPQRRLSVTLANGDVVSWPEPVREALKDGQEYWLVFADGHVSSLIWDGHDMDSEYLAFGNVHLTREAAQEHADARRKIDTQGVV